jgi:hypothetical protein
MCDILELLSCRFPYRHAGHRERSIQVRRDIVGLVVRDVLIIGALILANALFALSEMAVVSARKVRLQQRAEEGDQRARVALELAHAPNQFLSTIQIGITLVATLAGAFGGAKSKRCLALALRTLCCQECSTLLQADAKVGQVPGTWLPPICFENPARARVVCFSSPC